MDHPFQTIGADIDELPLTANGNRYAIVFQNFLKVVNSLYHSR